MKPTSLHDPLDDVMAAALHGQLTPEERISFETRLQNDPAARAAYQETQRMHDLLEKTQKEDRPDSTFEQRMVSGVRRRIQNPPQGETAWESWLVLGRAVRGMASRRWIAGAGLAAVLAIGILFSIPATQHHLLSGLSTHAPQDFRSAFRLADQAGASAFLAKEADSDQKTQKLSDAARPTGIAQMPMASPSPVPAEPSFSVSADTETLVADASSGSTQLLASKLETRGHVASNMSLNAIRTTSTAPMASSSPSVDRFAPAAAPPTADASPSRKLVRNAHLDLEVQSFQSAMDQISSLTQAEGGYIDTNSSERGGNGKLQGTVVVKVLPDHLDAFLLKLRDLGELKNQSVQTEDVTKAYYDTNARLYNARRMETQLQQLLQHQNGRVSDLLQVEREVGRVRGEIEQMQGELKLYDFQVAYATVTIQVREKDLHETAAYLLKEQDRLTLFSGNVEAAFQQVRKIADDFKAQVLSANLDHASASNVSADLAVMVAPDQIDAFLAQIKAVGRLGVFTKQDQRVAQDGGDGGQPADRARTEIDKVRVQIELRPDYDSRKQVTMTVVTRSVEETLDRAKAEVLALAGAEIISSSLNKAAAGSSAATLRVRVPGKDYPGLLDGFRALGRTASFGLHRNDNAGPGSSGDESPVVVTLTLTDNDVPIQQTAISILADQVDEKVRQIKQETAGSGIEITTSSFEREPNGIERARMTLHLPTTKYPALLESLRQLGKVESLSVHREDRPDQASADGTAPVEVVLELHNRGDLVAEEHGFWSTLRQTLGEGMGALFGSIRIIGVALAFLLPWMVMLALVAWIGRRVYLWSRKK